MAVIVSGCAENPNRINNTISDNFDRYADFHNKLQKMKDGKTYSPSNFVLNANNGCTINDHGKSSCPFEKEKEHLGEWPPKVGLALSGGGTRAASFSIGVLKALNEIGKLDEVDVISAVSGGAYAAYWYFSQNFYMDKVEKLIKPASYTKKDIFTTKQDGQSNFDNPNNYRFQKALEENSVILNSRHEPGLLTPLMNGLQYGVQLFIQGLSTPVYWVTNSLFDWELNMMPFFYYYKDGLDRTYGYVPLDYKLSSFANARPDNFTLRLIPNIDAEPLMMRDIAYFLTQKKEMPYFIINTTGRLGAKNAEFSRHTEESTKTMENRVFEFTPWGCHSALLGVNQRNEKCEEFRLKEPAGFDQLDFAKIVTISGAALDSQAQSVDDAGNIEDTPTWLDYLGDVSHFNMGYHIDNPNASGFRKAVHKLLPWPLYLIDDKFSDEKSASSIYLTDGGHSDNLGVYSLIRRGVKHIYLVDAEQDDNSDFSSAKRLKTELDKYNLELCSIENNNKRSNEDKTKISFQKQPMNVFNTEKPIFRAEIRSKNKNLRMEPISITYIKLSVPGRDHQYYRKETIELPFTVKSYMEMDENRNFPDDSTDDIFYSPEQFRAYRDLGYTLTKHYLDTRSIKHN